MIDTSFQSIARDYRLPSWETLIGVLPGKSVSKDGSKVFPWLKPQNHQRKSKELAYALEKIIGKYVSLQANRLFPPHVSTIAI